MPSPLAAYTGNAFEPRAGRRPPSSGAAGRRAAFPWIRLCLGSGVVIAAVAFLAYPQVPTPATSPELPTLRRAPVSAPPPLWQPIAQPAPAYAIDAPALHGLPFAYEARRDRSGAREDILTFGAHEQEAKAHVRLIAHHGPLSEEQGSSFFVDLARRAAEAGLAVTRSAPPSGLQTKFGLAEVADVTLSGNAERVCLAFRLVHTAAFRTGGWLCGAAGQPASRRQLACIVDRVTVLASDDPTLKAVFVQAERQRDETCAPLARVAEAPKPVPASRTARRR